MKELFIQFRNLYRNAVRNYSSGNNQEYLKKQTVVDIKTNESKKDPSLTNKVGKQEVEFGFGMGRAPEESKPTFKIERSLVGK